MDDGTCRVEWCLENPYRCGWCSGHYQRWKRYGDPLAGGIVRINAVPLPGEDWRPVAGYEGLYEVSSFGRVRSLPRLDARGYRRPGRLMRQSEPRHQEHYRVGLTRNRCKTTHLVHRLVAETFIGPCPAGMEVRHLDGDYLNNVLTNLTYGTHSRNMYDRRGHGTDHEAKKTHCKHGHEFTPENTRIARWPDGRFRSRICRTCTRRRNHDRRNRRWELEAA